MQKDKACKHTCDGWAVGAGAQDHGVVLQHLGQVLALLSGHLHVKAKAVGFAVSDMQGFDVMPQVLSVPSCLESNRKSWISSEVIPFPLAAFHKQMRAPVRAVGFALARIESVLPYVQVKTDKTLFQQLMDGMETGCCEVKLQALN